MPAGRTTIVAVALITAACAAPQQNAGTTTTTTPPTTPTSADQNKIDFADDVCDAVSKFVIPAASYQPDTSSPAATVASLKTQLGTLSAALAEANTDLGDVDTTGVPDGKAAVSDIQQAFGQIKQIVDRTRSKLDGLDPNNPQAVAAAVQDVAKDLAGLGSLKNPLDQPGMKGADMQQAIERAPACMQIKNLLSARISGTTTRTS